MYHTNQFMTGGSIMRFFSRTRGRGQPPTRGLAVVLERAPQLPLHMAAGDHQSLAPLPDVSIPPVQHHAELLGRSPRQDSSTQLSSVGRSSIMKGLVRREVEAFLLLSWHVAHLA